IRPFSTATTYAVTLICTDFDCPDLSNNIGNACDDGDSNTVNDIVNENCECIGDPIPVNNECSDAISLSCNDYVVGTTRGATDNVGCDGDSRQTVWYSFTADATGDVILSTCNPETNFDTDINVYTGTCDALTCFTGFEGNGYVDGNFDCVPQSFAGVGTLEAVAGQTYYIAITGYYAVGGFSAGEGEFGLSVECENAGAALNGTVNWNSSCGDRDGTVRLYTPNTATLIETYNITVAADGTFSIADLPTGTYDVIVKIQGYLAKGVQDVVIAAGANSLAVGAIKNGNINNDGAVNIFDVSLINAAFNTSVGNPAYNPLADLNCDGNINIFDISILNASFNQSGATAPLN
ncbi:hypothetical protein G3O08_20615, partial [Cryomorpha ignava]